MILQKSDLEQRLRWHLDRAVSVDIATAFIGDASSKLLRALTDYARRDCTIVRVIVGTMSQGGSSEDRTRANRRRQAIGSLADEGVNIREHNGSFHAKAYIFRHSEVTHAWIGSNNLTQSAFRNNDELALETIDQTDIEVLDAWFENRWKTAASREIRSFSILDGTRVGLSSGGATVDCRFEAAYVNAPSSRSFYWNTTWLSDEAIRVEDTNEAELDTHAAFLNGLTSVSAPRDAVTGEPILGTVELRHSIKAGESAKELLQACQASRSLLRLRIGPEHGGAYCDASVAELHRADDQTSNWDAVLAMRSCFRR